MSAIKSAVCLVMTTADGSETEESYHASETEAARALTQKVRACGWSRTVFFAGDALIYEDAMGEMDVIGIAQVRVVGY